MSQFILINLKSNSPQAAQEPSCHAASSTHVINELLLNMGQSREVVCCCNTKMSVLLIHRTDWIRHTWLNQVCLELKPSDLKCALLKDWMPLIKSISSCLPFRLLSAPNVLFVLYFESHRLSPHWNSQVVQTRKRGRAAVVSIWSVISLNQNYDCAIISVEASCEERLQASKMSAVEMPAIANPWCNIQNTTSRMWINL